MSMLSVEEAEQAKGTRSEKSERHFKEGKLCYGENIVEVQ